MAATFHSSGTTLPVERLTMRFRNAFLVSGLLTVCALSLAPREARAQVTIDFDSFATNATIPVGTFDAQGVRFDQVLQVSVPGTLPSSAPNAAASAAPLGGNITGFFLGPVTSVTSISVFAGDTGGDTDTVTLNGFDAANVLVDTATFTGISAQTLAISGAGIVRFEILQVGLIGIDDFQFTPTGGASAAAPEPGTLALLAGGIIPAVGMIRRRRSRAQAAHTKHIGQTV